MTLEGFGLIIVSLALLYAACWFVSAPMFGHGGKAATSDDGYSELLLLLKELEDDYESGRVPEEEYQRTRERLVEYAAIALSSANAEQSNG